MVSPAGKLPGLTLADAVIVAPAPTFTVATANTPVPDVPGMFTIPSPLSVATKAITSGTGVVDADIRTVLIPILTAASSVFDPATVNLAWAEGAGRSDRDHETLGRARRDADGAFGAPIGALVAESVV